MKRSKETPWDASRKISNPRKEQFAEYYTFEFWGKPVEAAAKAGYKILTTKKLRLLLTDPMIAERIRYLRKTLAALTIADDAWVKNQYIELMQQADKSADKLRALAGLYRAVADSEKTIPAQKEEKTDCFSLDDDDI